ncbi:MAG: N-acetylmuramoyl-L-alanine amidase, partial [Bacteroidetes bacterium]|nr:N-acetylmuramoyl-L-alanine amidase [Bacteroidota bacterium]
MIGYRNIIKKILKVILYFFIFFAIINNTYSQIRYNIINSQGTRTVHTSEVLNNISYLPLSQISPAIFPTGRYEDSKGEIKFKDGIIKITPLSFYIVYEKGNKVNAAQMNTPAIIINFQIYVPAVTFFKCLETLGIFSITQRNETFYFRNKSDTVYEEEIPFQEVKGDEEIQESPSLKELKHEITKKSTTNVFKEYFFEGTEKLRSGLVSLRALNDKRSGIREEEKIPINPSFDKHRTGTLIKGEIIEERIEKIDKPVYKGTVKPADKKYPPNLYVLPPNLIRKELEEEQESDTLKKNDLNEIYNSKFKDELFASTSLFSMYSLPQFIKITTELLNDTLVIHLVADSYIETYQAPDCSGKNLTLRIKNAVNSIDDFNDLKGIQNIKAEIIRDLLVYRIITESNIISCKSERNGSKELIYNIKLQTSNESVIPLDSHLGRNESPPPYPSFDKHRTGTLKKEEKTETQPTLEQGERETSDVNGFENEKRKWALDVIILDPGHGGNDPGAISINGYKEKDFTLKIAKKVRDLINENMPAAKVVMTRSDDRFIELFMRRQIANKNKGKLFVSIHLNSAATKPGTANGFETYILRPGRNDDAVRV